MGVDRGAGGRIGNRMSVEDVKAAHARETMGWKEHEKNIEKYLRLNGWTWWRDRVLPKRYGHAAQKVGRKAGLPDFIAFKVDRGEGRFLLIEAKTGRATTTSKQREWIDAANATPGAIRGLVVYPVDVDNLVKILGGEYGAF